MIFPSLKWGLYALLMSVSLSVCLFICCQKCGRGAAFAAATGVSDVSCPGKNFPPHHVTYASDEVLLIASISVPYLFVEHQLYTDNMAYLMLSVLTPLASRLGRLPR